MSNPFAGAMYLVTGFKLLWHADIRRYVVIPLSINVILFSLLFWLGALYFSDLVVWLQDSLPEFLAWLAWLMWPVFIIGSLLIGFFTFSLLANIVAAPFNGLLSAAVEKHLTGTVAEEDVKQTGFIAGFIPAIANEVGKMGYFLLWTIPLLLLFPIPGVNIVAPVLWFAFTAWMLSLEYLDYPLANRNLEFKEIRRQVASQRLAALGFGSMVNVAMMTPVFNFLVMPASVAGATAYAVDRLQQKQSTPNLTEVK